MQTDMYIEKNNKNTIISLEVPTSSAHKVIDAIKGILTLAGHEVSHYKEIDFDEIEKEIENSKHEKGIPASVVFPDASPAKVLRGLRGKEDITQIELAEKLGITQTMVSDMESGKRAISIKMAKRIEKAFNISYKVFL